MVQPPRPTAQPRIAYAGVTDVGRQRKHNEDCLLVRAELDLFCVADGMGGHNAGDVASKLVTTSLGNYFEATLHGGPPFELPEDYAALHPGARRLAAGVAKANRDVFTISNTHQQHHGMGSTCVAIHLSDGMVHIAHVGDSRCYRIRDGEMVQMTRDHSLINDALDMKPDLTKEELARLPKNIITRALGMKDVVKVDVKSELLQPGDVFLLCSDGLTGMVPVEQILEVITLTPEPQEACELLIAEANDHGGTDNISALLVRIEAPVPETDAAAELDVSAHVELDEEEEIDASAHAELDHDEEEEIDASAHAELDQSDEPADFELYAPPSSERITHPAAPVALRSPAPPPGPAVPPPAPSGAGDGAPPEERVPLVAVARAPILEIVSTEPEEGGRPDLEVGEEPSELDDLVTPEEAAALAAGGEIDLDVRGPWPNKPAVRRCSQCRFEIFPGNSFCVECGARIEAPIPFAGEP